MSDSLYVLQIAGHQTRMVYSTASRWEGDVPHPVDPPARGLDGVPGSDVYVDRHCLIEWGEIAHSIARGGGLVECEPVTFTLGDALAYQWSAEDAPVSDDGYVMTPGAAYYDQLAGEGTIEDVGVHAYATGIAAEVMRLRADDEVQIIESVSPYADELIVNRDPGWTFPRVVHIGQPGQAGEAVYASAIEADGAGRWRVTLTSRGALRTQREPHSVFADVGAYPVMTKVPTGTEGRAWFLYRHDITGEYETTDADTTAHPVAAGMLLANPRREGGRVFLEGVLLDAVVTTGITLPTTRAELVHGAHYFAAPTSTVVWQGWPLGAALRERCTAPAIDADPAGGIFISMDTAAHRALFDIGILDFDGDPDEGHPRSGWLVREGGPVDLPWLPVAYVDADPGPPEVREGVTLAAGPGAPVPDGPDIDIDVDDWIINAPAIERLGFELDGLVEWPGAWLDAWADTLDPGQVAGADGAWLALGLVDGDAESLILTVDVNWSRDIPATPGKPFLLLVDHHPRSGEVRRGDMVPIPAQWGAVMPSGSLAMRPDPAAPRILAYPIFARLDGAERGVRLDASNGARVYVAESDAAQGGRVDEVGGVIGLCDAWIGDDEPGALLTADLTPADGVPFGVEVVHTDPWEQGPGGAIEQRQTATVTAVDPMVLPDGSTAYFHTFREPLTRSAGDWPGYATASVDRRAQSVAHSGELIGRVLVETVGVPDAMLDDDSLYAFDDWPGVRYQWPRAADALDVGDVLEDVAQLTGTAIVARPVDGEIKLVRVRVGPQLERAPRLSFVYVDPDDPDPDLGDGVYDRNRILQVEDSSDVRAVIEAKVEANFDAAGVPQLKRRYRSGWSTKGEARGVELALRTLLVDNPDDLAPIIADLFQRWGGPVKLWALTVPPSLAAGVDLGDMVRVSHPELRTLAGLPVLDKYGIVIRRSETMVGGPPVVQLTLAHYAVPADARHVTCVLSEPVEGTDNKRWKAELAAIGPSRHPQLGHAITDLWWFADGTESRPTVVRLVEPADMDGGVEREIVEVDEEAGEVEFDDAVELTGPLWMIAGDDPDGDIGTRREALARFGPAATVRVNG